MQATIRSEFPALVPAFGILIGEVSAGLGRVTTLACLVIALMGITSRGHRVLSFAILIGIGLAAQLTTSIDNSELANQEVYLLRIVALPRYRVPGAVELELKPLARINTHPTYRITGINRQQIISCRAVELPWRNIYTLGFGQEFIARLKIDRLTPNETSPYRRGLWRRGIAATCTIIHSTKALSPKTLVDRARLALAQTVRRHVGDNESSGLFLGMALGMRDGITDNLERAFKGTALAHLLVLSGYQVTLAAFGIRAVAQRVVLAMSRSGALLLLADLAGLAAAVALTILTGFEAAALRATIALLITVYAQRHDRRASLCGVTIATLLVTVLSLPVTPFDLSSLLTFGALFGITLGVARPSRFRLVAWIQILLYCSLATSALSALFFKTFCPSALLFNAVFAPLLSVVSCNLGIPAMLLALCGSSIGIWALQLSANFINCCAAAIAYFADSPLAAWELSASSSLAVAILLTLPLIVRLSRCLEYYLLRRGLYPHI